MNKAVLLMVLVVFVLLPMGQCITNTAGYNSWLDYYLEQGAKDVDYGNVITIDLNGKSIPINTYIPQTTSKKDSSEYFVTDEKTPKVVFLASDQDNLYKGKKMEAWENILTYIPATVWVPSESDLKWCNLIFDKLGADDLFYTPKCAYPFLIYHQEQENYDLDSAINFLKVYKPDWIILVGPVKNKLSELEKETNKISNIIHTNLPNATIMVTDLRTSLGYWKNTNSVLFVDHDYSLAVLAAQYAAYEDTPLIIAGSPLDSANTYVGRTVFCVGNSNPAGAQCNNRFDKNTLIKAISVLTRSDKFLVTNTKDISNDYCENASFETDLAGQINKLYCHDSLAAAYLATAKEEMVLELNSDPSYSMGAEEMQESNVAAYDMEVIGNHVYLSKKDIIEVYTVKEGGIPEKVQEYTYKTPCKNNLLYRKEEITGRASELYHLSYCLSAETQRFEYVLQRHTLDDTGRIVNSKEINSPSLLLGKIEINKETGDLFMGGANGEIVVYTDVAAGLISYVGSSPTYNIEHVVSFENGFIYLGPLPNPKIEYYELELPPGVGLLWSVVYLQKNEQNTQKNHYLELKDDKQGYSTTTIKKYETWSDDISEPHYTTSNGANLYMLDDVGRIKYFKIRPDKVEYLGFIYKANGIKMLEVNEDYLFILGSDGLQVLTLSTNEITKPETSERTKPKDLISAVLDKINNYPAFSNTKQAKEIVQFITYLASPKALQLSYLENKDIATTDHLATKQSVDFVLTELFSKGESQAIPPQTEKFDKPYLKAYGRIYGLSVSDTSAYTMRSLFANEKEGQIPKFSAIAGQDTEVPLSFYYLGVDLQKGYDYQCILDTHANGIDYSVCKSKTITEQDIMGGDITYLIASGDAQKIKPQIIFDKMFLKVPQLILSTVPQGLDYYGDESKQPIGPTLLRLGVMGYLGSVSPKTVVSSNDGMFSLQIDKLSTEKAPLGELIGLPLFSGGVYSDKYSLEYSLLGDPTYQSKYFGRVKKTTKTPQESIKEVSNIETPEEVEEILDCGCSAHGYETYNLGGCIIKSSSMRLLAKNIKKNGMGELKNVGYLSCLTVLKISSWLGFGINIQEIDYSFLSGAGNLEVLDVSDTKFGDSDLQYITNMYNLKVLNLKSTSITNIEGISNLLSLEELSIGFNEDLKLSNLETIANLPIKNLDISFISLDSFRGVENLRLDRLDMTGLKSSSYDSISNINAKTVQLDESTFIDLYKKGALMNLNAGKIVVRAYFDKAGVYKIAKQYPEKNIEVQG